MQLQLQPRCPGGSPSDLSSDGFLEACEGRGWWCRLACGGLTHLFAPVQPRICVWENPLLQFHPAFLLRLHIVNDKNTARDGCGVHAWPRWHGECSLRWWLWQPGNDKECVPIVQSSVYSKRAHFQCLACFDQVFTRSSPWRLKWTRTSGVTLARRSG